MITVLPLGGLGNRMRVLDSAFSLARSAKSDLHVLWCLDKSLNCSFFELFIADSDFYKITEIDLHKLSGRLKKRFLFFLKEFSSTVISQEQIEKFNFSNSDLVDLAAKGDVFIETFSRFYSSQSPYADLVLSRTIRKTVDLLLPSLENAVGIHVRRSDNKESIAHSPTWKFIDEMYKEINCVNDTKFFLCTDSKEEEEIFLQEFSDRIILLQKKSFNRDDPVAIREALLDLYCLSHCRKIIGSYWSSFSGVASEIGGVERLVIDVCQKSN